jgi:hypothetical protein
LVQVAGKGQHLSVEHLSEALAASASLRRVCLRYADAFLVQMAETALSHRAATRSKSGRHAGCFWLMTASMTMTSPSRMNTSQSCSAPVTIALQELDRRGWITHGRGVVTVIEV